MGLNGIIRLLIISMLFLSQSGYCFKLRGGFAITALDAISAVEASMPWTDHLELGVALYSGSGDVKGGDEDDVSIADIRETLTASQFSLALRSRYFTSVDGSFNVTAQLAYNSFDGDYGFSNSFSKATVPFESSIISAGLAVGNEWRWEEGFIIGCDWVSISLPLLVNNDVDLSGTSAETVGAFAGGNAETRVEEITKDLTRFMLLNFYIGWQF